MAWRGPTKPNNNPAPNNINSGVISNEQLKSTNRAEDKRRDTDVQKTFSVTLHDVDSTIFNYLNDVVNPHIVDNGQLIKVPINYASPERWKSIQIDGYMRDKHGKIQCPMIAYRRSSMQRNSQLSSFNRRLEMTTIRGYSIKNRYDKFSVMNRFAPVKEMYLINMPDHVVINYEFVIWTDKIEQLNGIVEKINFSTRDYWGDKKRFKFRTFIEGHDFQTEVNAEQDRTVKSTFTLLVHAYLLPEIYEDYNTTTQKVFTKRKVVFNSEAVSSIPDLTRQKSQELDYSNFIIPVSPDTTGFTYTQSLVNTELANPENYADRTDFQNGMSEYDDVMNYQSEYSVKTGSILSIDNGSGSSIVVFNDTTFNSTNATDSTYRKLILYIDNVMLKESSVVSFQSGSSIYATINNSYSGVTPTIGSNVVGYGNIQ